MIFKFIKKFLPNFDTDIDKSKRKFIKITGVTGASIILTSTIDLKIDKTLKVVPVSEPIPTSNADLASHAYVDAQVNTLNFIEPVQTIKDMMNLPLEGPMGEVYCHAEKKMVMAPNWTKKDAIHVFVNDLYAGYLRNPDTLEWVQFSGSEILG